MPDTEPQITIPTGLLPADGRFGSGPSKVRTVDSLIAAAKGPLGTSHRQAPVKSIVARLRQGLSELFKLPDGYEVVLGNGGTTAFWDIATFCLIEQRSQHLSFGEFSSKFAAAAQAAPWLSTPEVIESPVGTHPLAEGHAGTDLYALTHNETSTGVMMEIRRPDGADAGRSRGRGRYVGGGGPAGGAVAVRRLLLRPTERFRFGRGLVGRPFIACRGGPGRTHKRIGRGSCLPSSTYRSP